MTMKNKIATVFGGTGFVGSQIVREMAKKGWTVKIVTRVPESAYYLKPCGTVGQVVPVACDYSSDESIQSAVKGSDYVVNCIGILYQRGKSKFGRIHTELPEVIAKACSKENVERFVQISSLGCDKGTSKYAQSKLAGENAALKAFPQTTILRPSVIFGPKDDFFNMFARIARYVPVLPLIGGGKTKYQPVFVGDVADAVMASLCLSAGEKDPRGKIYELGGPEVFSFKELYEKMFGYTGQKRMLVSLPWGVAKVEACFLSMLPKPLLTPDQVESLKTDNIVGNKALTLADLGVEQTGMELILPSYLEQYRAGGRFSDKKRA